MTTGTNEIEKKVCLVCGDEFVPSVPEEDTCGNCQFENDEFVT
jgi:hypothetical protein